MPEGRKIRSECDYIFRLSGISCRRVTVPNGAPAQKTAWVTEVGREMPDK